MKELFKSFYYPDENGIKEIWGDKNTLFVLDANILLNLYRYNDETIKDFFKLLNFVKDQVFIPHHAALEYQKNRISVIAEQRKYLGSFIKALDKDLTIVDILFEGKEKNSYKQVVKKYPELSQALENINNELQRLKNDNLDKLNEEAKKLLANSPHVNSFDSIRTELDNLQLIVGEPYSEKELEDIYKEGARRYSLDIPPGFEDKDKIEKFSFSGQEYQQKYGDYIIWEQIKLYAKNHPDLTNIIFISDDVKKDWLQSFDSDGTKIIGARTELCCEIYNGYPNIKWFLIHDSNTFLELGNKVHDLKVQQQSFDDVRNILYSNIIKSNYLLSRNKFDSSGILTRKITDYDENTSTILNDKSYQHLDLLLSEVLNLKEMNESLKLKLHNLYQKKSRIKDHLKNFREHEQLNEEAESLLFQLHNIDENIQILNSSLYKNNQDSSYLIYDLEKQIEELEYQKLNIENEMSLISITKAENNPEIIENLHLRYHRITEKIKSLRSSIEDTKKQLLSLSNIGLKKKL